MGGAVRKPRGLSVAQKWISHWMEETFVWANRSTPGTCENLCFDLYMYPIGPSFALAFPRICLGMLRIILLCTRESKARKMQLGETTCAGRAAACCYEIRIRKSIYENNAAVKICVRYSSPHYTNVCFCVCVVLCLYRCRRSGCHERPPSDVVVGCPIIARASN